MADAAPAAITRLPNTLVVLIMPSLFADADFSSLRATLTSGPGQVRLLISLSASVDPGLATILATTGRPLEWLLAPGLPPPPDATTMLSMPPGSTKLDQDNLALALSDVVIATPHITSPVPPLPEAKALGLRIIAPGEGLPCPPAPGPSVVAGLDPANPGWHTRFSFLHGRTEQGLLELLAWPWRNSTAEERASSYKALRKCFRRSWGASPYYGPPLPLSHAGCMPQASEPLLARFEAYDRAAVHGAYIHRDLIWYGNGLGTAAVLAALAGHLDLFGTETLWAYLELLTLLIVAASVTLTRWTALQERWTACRVGAEQLRIALMCRPLAVVPAFLLRPATSIGEDLPATHSAAIDFATRVSAEVKRAVRDQGLPRLPPNPDPTADAQCLRGMVDDQYKYHLRNAHKLERAERTLHYITVVAFWISVAAVVLHFKFHSPYYLLVTAGGPAVVAALHGATTRLGILHRIALSVGAAKRLGGIRDAVDTLIADLPYSAGWQEVNTLAQSAAAAMGGENEEWHGLVRREPDDYP